MHDADSLEFGVFAVTLPPFLAKMKFSRGYEGQCWKSDIVQPNYECVWPISRYM